MALDQGRQEASLSGTLDNDHAWTRDYAQSLDQQDYLARFREEFHIPSHRHLQRERASDFKEADTMVQGCIYLAGHSLGLQPRRTADYIKSHLLTWATKGLEGHFTSMLDSPIPRYVDAGDVVARRMAKLVGASTEPMNEVAVMQTLTANLHLLMASFYRPDLHGRYKIVVEEKAFPSDYYAIESQICHHNLDPAEAMIIIRPDSPDGTISTDHILSVIRQHASTIAVVLLPGVQFYTGQYLDIRTITAYAHSTSHGNSSADTNNVTEKSEDAGIIVGWDLAHAIGNVELCLHDWNVDFAIWCNYKYVNGGPGVIGGLFVHENHGRVDTPVEEANRGLGYRHRLSGWWGGNRSSRFRMENKFIPLPGAAGYQLSNPSILDISAVLASLSLFEEAGGMQTLRQKSLRLTEYLEYLLGRQASSAVGKTDGQQALEKEVRQPEDSVIDQPRLISPAPHTIYRIITPPDAAARGAQLSIRFFPDSEDHQPVHQTNTIEDPQPGQRSASTTKSRLTLPSSTSLPTNTEDKEAILTTIISSLQERGIVADHRCPDVIRVAPVPLYNSFDDVWTFAKIFKETVVDTLVQFSGC